MYCVHCGVRLEEGKRKCPLCGTMNTDPNENKNDAGAKQTYPVYSSEQRLEKNKKHILTGLAFLMGGTAILCLALDLIIRGALTWSIFPVVALLMCYFAIALPLLLKRHRVYLSLMMDTAFVLIYLLMVDMLTGDHGWFVPIAMPVVLLVAALFFVTVYMRRNRVGRVSTIGIWLVFAGVLCMVTETLLSLHFDHMLKYTWSPFALIPCLFIGGLIIYISRDKALMEELRKRLFF